MSTAELFAAVKAGKIDEAEFNRKVAEASQKPLKLKVSEKGAVSLYGINAQFPVTLYAGQWDRVLGYADSIRAFIRSNKAELSTK